jgi:DNA-binding transcriptional LysR family regulator
LYRETDSLVCTRAHPLAAVHEPEALRHAIPAARKVVRGFLGALEFAESDARDGRDEHVGDTDANVVVTNVEAALHLILTGAYIGFLPRHYSRAWIERGELVELLPGLFVRHSDFFLVTHPNGLHQRAIQAFVDCLDPVGHGTWFESLRRA